MKIIKDTYPQLYDFQKIGVDFLSKSRSALLADDVGTGKTAQAIHACQQVGARSVLVICTASIKYNWRKEAIKWGYDERDVHILTNRSVANLQGDGIGMYIINYDLCWRKTYAKVLFKRKFDVLICDEAHYLKNHQAKRAKAVWLRNGYADISTHRWMMTATPVLNRPVELHAMLSRLCPDRLGEYKNYIAYTKRYCDGKDGKWGYEADGAENLDELAGRLEGFMLRRTRDVLPAKTLQKIYMPFSKDIERHMFTGKENASVRRLIGIGKVSACAEHIMNILEAEHKIVLFAYHTDVIRALDVELFKYNPVILDGKTASGQRQKVIDRFVEDPECRVFIGQVKAAGEGIDGLQHVASIAVFVEIDHTPGVIKQAMGRLYREGQKRPCLFQFLIVEGTVDEQILDSTLFKDKNIQAIMKDEESSLDFSNKPKKEKEKMTVESELKRIADACERWIELREKDVEITLSSNVNTSAQSVEGVLTPAPAKKPKKSKKKESAPINNEVPTTVEEYQAKMRGIANRISSFTKDPAKTNALFAKLQGEFKVQFPDNEHVFDVKPGDFAEVCNLVDGFLESEGIK